MGLGGMWTHRRWPKMSCDQKERVCSLPWVQDSWQAFSRDGSETRKSVLWGLVGFWSVQD